MSPRDHPVLLARVECEGDDVACVRMGGACEKAISISITTLLRLVGRKGSLDGQNTYSLLLLFAPGFGFFGLVALVALVARAGTLLDRLGDSTRSLTLFRFRIGILALEDCQC